jgi:serine/threonine protein kinase
MAPEIQAGREYDESVDVWSFGMLLVELVTLSLPYADVSVLDIQSTVSSLQLPRIQVHQNTDAESATKLRAIIDTCLQFDASKRPSAERLVALVLEL